MAGKKKKTDGQKSRQKRRTHKNKAKKYENLIKQFPHSPQIEIWIKKLEFSKSKV